MKINYSKQFIKKFKKCDTLIQKAFRDKLILFIEDKFLSQLNNHALKGKLKGYRSINITGDWRAIFVEYENGEVVFFEMMGTHSELYR